MKKVKSTGEVVLNSPENPARTPEEREDQLIALAIDRAEQQIRDGTASSQVITHFLKLGSSTERMEKELLQVKKELMSAKKEAMEAVKRVEELYSTALQAFQSYRGDSEDEHD